MKILHSPPCAVAALVFALTGLVGTCSGQLAGEGIQATSGNGSGATSSSTSPTAGGPPPVPIVDRVAQAPPKGPVIPAHEDKRAYGVLPNYRTAEADIPFEPITSRQKWSIGLKDSFDGSSYPLSAFFAAINQLSDTNPSFGQGVEGYAKRWGTAFGDQVIGNMMTESFLPAVLHEDPRFFRRGTGRFWSRVAYSASRVVICRNDSGTNTFNVSEFLGNGTAASIANSYYADERGYAPTFQRMFTAIGTDAVANILKEFWPDVKRYYIRKHREKQEKQARADAGATE